MESLEHILPLYLSPKQASKTQDIYFILQHILSIDVFKRPNKDKHFRSSDTTWSERQDQNYCISNEWIPGFLGGHSALDLWESVRPWVQMDVCAKFEENSSRHSWHIMLIRWMDYNSDHSRGSQHVYVYYWDSKNCQHFTGIQRNVSTAQSIIK